MRDATPPQPDPGPAQQLAWPTARTVAPRSGFGLSLLSAIGVMVAVAAAPWPFIDPNLGFWYGAVVVLSVMLVLAVSLALAILGLSRSVSWRQAGGRDRLTVLSIVLASLAIDLVALGVILFVLMVAVIIMAFGQI